MSRARIPLAEQGIFLRTSDIVSNSRPKDLGQLREAATNRRRTVPEAPIILASATPPLNLPGGRRGGGALFSMLSPTPNVAHGKSLIQS